MIVRLSGRLLEKQPDHVVIDVQGVGYHVWTTLTAYEGCPEPGQETALLIYHQIRENSQDLFGFANTEERKVFNHLISIGGIGAKTAVTILSSVLPEELCRQVQQDDEGAITAIRGVGPKTARRIITELKDKIGVVEGTGNTEQASQSLEALGYKPREARKAVQSAIKRIGSNAPIEDLIRAALAGGK